MVWIGFDGWRLVEVEICTIIIPMCQKVDVRNVMTTVVYHRIVIYLHSHVPHYVAACCALANASEHCTQTARAGDLHLKAQWS